MELIKKNSKFNFVIGLFDGKENKYVRVTLSNKQTGVVIGEYVCAFNSSDKKYRNSTVDASFEGVFLATYIVYKDDQFTQRDRRYRVHSETIRVEDFVETLREIIDQGDGRVYTS